MIIIKLQGGLGNQLFQFAAYSKLIKNGHNAFLDISEYNLPKNDSFRKYYLSDFNIRIPTKKCSFSPNFKQRLKQQIKLPSIKYFNESLLKNLNKLNIHDGYNLSDNLHEIENNTYVTGYFLNERFIPDNFFDFFSFSVKTKKLFIESPIYSKILNSNSISVHIRRTDYISNPEYASICTLQYYTKAINYFLSHNQSAEFFFFSDDIEWVKNNLGNNPNYHFIENQDSSDNTIRDLFYMSSCKNNIVANSTFSWWGAYLNRNPNKIVIRPDKYQNISDIPIYPQTWINIESL